MKTVVFAVIFSAVTLPVAAQWLNHPTPGIPRTANGKPNLTAAAPRTADGKPDLSGIWEPNGNKYLRNIAADLKPEDVPYQPWARAKQQEIQANMDNPTAQRHVDPQARCLPLHKFIRRSPLLRARFAAQHAPRASSMNMSEDGRNGR